MATNIINLFDIIETISEEDINKELDSYLTIYKNTKLDKFKYLQEKMCKLNNILKQTKLKCYEERVKYLQNCKQYIQKTPEWYSIRNTMFTASADVCDILGKSEYGGNIKKTIKKKCGLLKAFKGNRFTHHGVKYEDVAIGVYETRYNKKVLEFGLMKHKTLNCLGASPDGITTDGRMVEIKVPFVRVPDGKIKIGYFIQMQTQLEVFDLDVCDFFECNITEYFSKEQYDNDKYVKEDLGLLDIIPKTTDLNHIKVHDDRRTAYGLEKGMIGRLGYYSTGEKNKYFYPPMTMNSEEQYNWLLEKKKENKTLVIDYWKIDISSYNEVPRDKVWWKENDVENKLLETWEKVKIERNRLNILNKPN